MMERIEIAKEQEAPLEGGSLMFRAEADETGKMLKALIELFSDTDTTHGH